ncbi:hypothetical protein [Billgrantia gudaonensis]|uniref:Uncharacterized protein n=1 Tax=Billgrantia gudaonensis TaxID=376427 RepID=A0A1G8MNX5_9GAMM|nr:hypothetical protein [Halomonas gudaonensis]SDI69592.1 hypothetical protein SAMN04487954_10166 [Halomonas gudaonensis]
MKDIELIPDPIDGWIMMCPCGATEIRTRKCTRWETFELHALELNRYRITCKTCGNATEKRSLDSKIGVTSATPS